MGDYFGLSTSILENDLLHLEYLTSAGPRIVRFSAQGDANMFAELPEIGVDTLNGRYYFRGGHRLWRSPELIPETYHLDNDAPVVEKLDGGVRLLQNVPGGISKSIEIKLSRSRAAVTLKHRLTNNGSDRVSLAPWAITMFRQSGTVILPQAVGNTDAAGLLHNRIFVLWPYTQINDQRLDLRDDFILLRAAPSLPPIKLGTFNPHGWIAYWLDGRLFRKSFNVTLGATYPDAGSNSEIYCNDKFVELESLGPLTTLEPGKWISHMETWELYDNLDLPFLPEWIREVIQQT